MSVNEWVSRIDETNEFIEIAEGRDHERVGA